MQSQSQSQFQPQENTHKTISSHKKVLEERRKITHLWTWFEGGVDERTTAQKELVEVSWSTDLGGGVSHWTRTQVDFPGLSIYANLYKT